MAELEKKNWWPPGYIIAQAVVFAVVALYCNRNFFEDDSFISLRFAKNLIEGKGLVWNAGVRLEGYTNFLLIMLVSALGKLGIDLVTANRLVGFAAFGGTVWVMHHYMRAHTALRSYGESVASALALSLVVSSIPLLAWCFGGLEGDLMAFFVTLSLCNALRLIEGRGKDREAGWLGFGFALAACTRPEGALLFAFTGAFLALLWVTRWAPIRFRQLVIAANCFAIMYLPYTGWRIWYFGEFLPNTYYAKEYHVAHEIIARFGKLYVGSYLLAPPALPVLAGVMLVLAGVSGRLTAAAVFLASFIVFFFGFIYSVGGDFMPYFRFMLPIVPVQALLVYHCGVLLMRNGKPLWLRNMSTIILVMMVMQFALVEEEKPISRGALSGAAVAKYIDENWPHGSVIAINPAGALPYMDNDYHYIDMLGLNDRHIAHTSVDRLEVQSQTVIGHLKGDGAYVLARKPNYIIFSDVWGAPGPWFISDVQMSRRPEFMSDYERVEVYVTPPAELLDELKRTRDRTLKAAAEGWANPNAIGPIMDEQDRVRFIYFKRKH